MKTCIPTYIPADFAKSERGNLAILKRQLKEAIITIEYHEACADEFLSGVDSQLEYISPHLALMLRDCRKEQEILALRTLLRLIH